MNRRLLLLAIVLCAVAALGGLGVRPVGDDWPTLRHTVRWADSGTIVAESLRPQVIHWSPLWFWTDSVCYALDPSTYGLSILTAVRFAFLLAACLAFLLLADELTPAGAAIGMAIVVFHQAAIGTLYQWKGIGGLAGHALGAVAFALVARRRSSVAAAALFFAGLLFKESVITWAAIIILFLLATKRWRAIAPIAAAAVAFLALRQLAGTPVSLEQLGGEMGDRYRLVFTPAMWGKNIAELIGATLSPVSSVRWYDALQAHDVVRLVAFATITIAVNVIVFAAARRRKALAAALLLGCVPIAFLNHVSEGYVSPLIFWYALLVAYAASRDRRVALAMLLVAVLHAASFFEKRSMMEESSRREEAAGLAVARAASQLPRDATVWVTAAQIPHAYSFFRTMAGDQAAFVEIPRLRVPVTITPEGFEYLLRVAADGSVTVARNPNGRSRELVTPY